MSRFRRELSQAARSLWRARPVTMIAIGTLALGIGATSSLFSVLDPVLLTPLPYADADALVAIHPIGEEGADAEGTSAFPLDVLGSFGGEPDLFEAVGGWRPWSPILTALGEATELSGIETTEGFLPDVLGVQPILGRSFLPEEHRSEGTRTVILSHAFWVDRMGGDPDVLGAALTLDQLPYTIVGVLPARFRSPAPAPATVWTPARPEVRCGSGCPRFRAIGRLRGGLALALANERAATLALRNAETRPKGEMATSARLVPLRSDLLGTAPRALTLLAAAVGLALLAACVNVAALQRVRAASRRREFLVRRALGAGRAAVARLWMTEAVTLAVVGGGLGLLIAVWGTELLTALAPPEVPALSEVGVNGRVLSFTAVVTLVTAVLSGLVPALRESDDGPGTRPPRAGSWLGVAVFGQVAASMVLLVGTGLLLRSLHELNAEDPGVTSEGVVAVRIELAGRLDSDLRGGRPMVDSLLTGMRSSPGVVTVAATTALPMDGGETPIEAFRVEAGPDEPLAAWGTAAIRGVSPGFFYAVSQRLLDGRDFDDADTDATGPVAIVSESLARIAHAYPYESPIGLTIVIGAGRSVEYREIVGVVADVAQAGVRGPVEPAVYVPLAQSRSGLLTLVIQSEDDMSVQESRARSAAATIGDDVVILDVRPWDDLVVETRRAELFATRLLAALALCALLIGAGGLYGVVAQGVTIRLRELGIRRSLGADAATLRRLCVRNGIRLALGGIVVGLLVAATFTRLLEPLLFRVSAHDPIAFLGPAAVLGAVVLLATWIPSRAATSVDPASVLREE